MVGYPFDGRAAYDTDQMRREAGAFSQQIGEAASRSS
ncbi:hypothetical protein BH23ACT6_BH23ACT6_14460 [soil metagenome]